LIKIGSSVGDFGQDRSVFELELGQQALGIRLPSKKIVDSLDGNGLIADVLAKAIADGVSGIGGDEEYFLVWILFGEIQSTGDGRRGFSHASLAPKEDKLPVIFQKTGPHVRHIQTSP
jgi:hypothetical protein